MNKTEKYDVIVAGASVAGCAAALMYADAGARVALMEAHRTVDAHKVLCTHHLHACGTPVLDRIGVTDELLEHGMVRTVPRYWTRWGWITPREVPGNPPSFNIRRATLDPILRRKADTHPQITLHLGTKVRGLLTNDGTVAGVYATNRDRDFVLEAPLTVGADGRNSIVAEAIGSKAKLTPNGRFSYFAHLKDIVRPDSDATLSWFRDPDVAYLMPNDGGVSVLAVIPTKEQLAEFRTDLTGSFLAYANSLPGCPTISTDNIVGKIVGTTDYPLIRREPVASRVGLIGDAAASNDPLWGIGCAWALRSAAWLVDNTAAAVISHDGAAIDAGLGAYRKQRRRELSVHQQLMSGYASGRELNPIERVLYSAAARDSEQADRFHLFGSRQMSAGQYLSPRSLASALRVNVRRGATPSMDATVPTALRAAS